MSEFPEDIFTEPENVDPDTLANLGPLRALAGVWEGPKGLDINPGPGEMRQPYIERIEMQPIDPQTNGPQLFYGLAYVIRIVKPDEPETYHHQVGHWLWEPATGAVIQTLSIPRGQTAMAVGRAAPDANVIEVNAVRGSTVNGISSNPFLEHAYRTDSYRLVVVFEPDGRWSYLSETVLKILGQDEPFLHVDRNTLTKVAEPTPNPLSLV
jgi:hypothetical protein